MMVNEKGIKTTEKNIKFLRTGIIEDMKTIDTLKFLKTKKINGVMFETTDSVGEIVYVDNIIECLEKNVERQEKEEMKYHNILRKLKED